MTKAFTFFLLALVLLVLPIRWILAMVVAAVVHEMGHILAVKFFGGRLLCSFYWNGAYIRTCLSSRWKQILAIMAGPLAGAALVLLFRFMPRVSIAAAVQTVFNLLPVYPLDGGRLLQCLPMGERALRWIEHGAVMVLLLLGGYLSFGMRLGALPMVMAFAAGMRLILEKYLAKRRRFEYNSVYQRK